MAYSNYFQPFQPPVMYQTYQPQQNTIQNGGFVSVRSEDEARNYPVALGNSVTFKDETAPYIYTKTMGFSQLDRPTFERYKLVKETPSEAVQVAESPIDNIRAEIESIWNELNDIKKNIGGDRQGGKHERYDEPVPANEK